MFELYDEQARRTLFFARYEASRLGVRAIEADHILLALMREPRSHAGRLLLTLPLPQIRKELESNRTGQKVDTSVEIPFSAETKRIFQHACDEADGLAQSYIGPEHLLLGLLRERESRPSIMLARYGMQLEGARERIRESYAAAAAGPVVRSAEPVPKSAVQAQLEQIIESANQLRLSLSSDPEAVLRVHMLLLELKTLKSLLDEQQ
ncbi:MAG TPA: Clp protease N-terminal domain-containing protein [Vicinamibacterales bacterium]|nr:Clp protease N-terminal domain-containing protein [Vicinamibacterales bacterium]